MKGTHAHLLFCFVPCISYLAKSVYEINLFPCIIINVAKFLFQLPHTPIHSVTCETGSCCYGPGSAWYSILCVMLAKQKALLSNPAVV